MFYKAFENITGIFWEHIIGQKFPFGNKLQQIILWRIYVNIVAKPHEYSLNRILRISGNSYFFDYLLICHFKPSLNGCY